MAEVNLQESDLCLFRLTFSDDMKGTDYIESTARLLVKKVGSLCHVVTFPMTSALNLASALMTQPFTPASIVRLISLTRSKWQLMFKMTSSQSLTGAKDGLSILMPPKLNCLKDLSLPSIGMANANFQESDSLHLLWIM